MGILIGEGIGEWGMGLGGRAEERRSRLIGSGRGYRVLALKYEKEA